MFVISRARFNAAGTARQRTREWIAEYNAAVGAYTSDAVKNNIITVAQGLQALVDENVYPDEFLPTDITPDTTLADDEKPEDEQAEEQVQVPAVPTMPEVPIVKSAALELMEQESQAAIQLVKKYREELDNA